jgi:hypothetical protein
MSEQAEGVLPRSLALAAWWLVAAGVLARVVRFIGDRPLWADEASVALMVLERTPSELLVPQLDDPVTPVGFLLATNASTWLFGGGELALRLVPFASGLAALPLFYAFARELLPRREALFALVLFSISEPLIFYASELKQYSTDVLVGLLVLWPGARLLAGRGPLRGPLACATLAGAAGIWLSLPAIFVCGGLVVALAARAALASGESSRGWGPAVVLVLAFGASFAFCYLATVAPQQANTARAGWWGTFYPPLPVSWAALVWYPRSFFGFFNDPLGLPAVGVAAATFIAGLVRLARRDGSLPVLLIAPLGLAFAAAVLRLAPFPTSLQYDLLDGYYPFFGRVLLFAVPQALIVLAEGVGLLVELSVRRFAYLGAVAIAVLMATPVYVLVRNTWAPPVIQDMRSLAEQMLPHVEDADRLLTLGYAEPVVDYYALRTGLPRPDRVLKLRTQAHVGPLLEVLASIPPGARFWFATVHHPHWPSRAERDALLPVFARVADELESFESYRGHAHLYRRR